MSNVSTAASVTASFASSSALSFGGGVSSWWDLTCVILGVV